MMRIRSLSGELGMNNKVNKMSRAEAELADRMIEKEDMVLVCKHVLDKSAEAEYHKEDDSYVCTKCRDNHAENPDDLSNLSMAHRSCLGV